jgi:hypothetical protein
MDWLVCEQGFFLFSLCAAVSTACLPKKKSQTQKNKKLHFRTVREADS